MRAPVGQLWWSEHFCVTTVCFRKPGMDFWHLSPKGSCLSSLLSSWKRESQTSSPPFQRRVGWCIAVPLITIDFSAVVLIQFCHLNSLHPSESDVSKDHVSILYEPLGFVAFLLLFFFPHFCFIILPGHPLTSSSFVVLWVGQDSFSLDWWQTSFHSLLRFLLLNVGISCLELTARLLFCRISEKTGKLWILKIPLALHLCSAFGHGWVVHYWEG